MIQSSELILNPDGSIYHLHLRPEHLAKTIITVGDPDRVPAVSKHFDRIEYAFNKREFITHTGYIGNKRLSVISTGIGPDNIDIVFNEIDALYNIDLETRRPKSKLTSLSFVRIGTSGALQADIPVDSFLLSSYAIGWDNLFSFYELERSAEIESLEHELAEAIPDLPVAGTLVKAPGDLQQHFPSSFLRGITLTCPGFYAPQGRQLRLPSRLKADHFSKMQGVRLGEERITNMEMETSAIYGMAQLLGHQALSCNAILANRPNGEFSKAPARAVELMITEVLGILVDN
ncbi:MAG: nucleoside phosphorylase [Saprospiraceae bacterium]|nr:nucleoside phosphorylase [Saprospiraceae bacterium]